MRAFPHRPTAGFTMIETMVTIAVLALGLRIASSLFATTDNLVKESRARMRVTAEHRRSLEAISNVLRGADLTTLTGFQADGTSTQPRFKRVEDATLATRTLGPVEELQWVASAQSVDGVPQPGAVFLVEVGGTRLLADRVPSGGFLVRQEGRNLVIELTTYYVTSARRTAFLTSASSVSARN